MGKLHGLERHYTSRVAGRKDGFAQRNGTAGGRHLAYQSWSGLTLISRCRRAAHASTAAWAAASVVMHVTPWATAAARILPSSVRAPLPLGVLMTRATSSFFIRSIRLGRPSWILGMTSTTMPAARSALAVPPVEISR